jgi:hypothetical protein
VSRIVDAARRLVRTEPVRVAQLVAALVVIAAFFGLDLDADQLVGLVVAVQTILALVLREAVYAPATVEAETDVAYRRGVQTGYSSAAADGRL